LLEIKATNIASTNATFTGTVTMNSFTVSGTFTVDTIEATTLILNGLTDATTNQIYGLSVFDTVTQNFYKVPGLQYNPFSNTLTTTTLRPTNVIASLVDADIIQMDYNVEDTSAWITPILFRGVDRQIKTSSNLDYQPSTSTLHVTNINTDNIDTVNIDTSTITTTSTATLNNLDVTTNIDTATISVTGLTTVDDIDINGDVKLLGILPSSSHNLEFSVLFKNNIQNTINKDVDINFNPAFQRLTVPNIASINIDSTNIDTATITATDESTFDDVNIDGFLKLQTIGSSTLDASFSMLFKNGSTTEINIDPQLNYNPFQNLLTTSNITATQNVIIADTLTMTTSKNIINRRIAFKFHKCGIPNRHSQYRDK
jgi:hypothetical protein